MEDDKGYRPALVRPCKGRAKPLAEPGARAGRCAVRARIIDQSRSAAHRAASARLRRAKDGSPYQSRPSCMGGKFATPIPAGAIRLPTTVSKAWNTPRISLPTIGKNRPKTSKAWRTQSKHVPRIGTWVGGGMRQGYGASSRCSNSAATGLCCVRPFKVTWHTIYEPRPTRNSAAADCCCHSL